MELKKQERLCSDLILILVAIIWGSSFPVQRMAANALGVMLYNGSRFIVGAAAAFIIAGLRGKEITARFTRQEWLGGLLCGLCIFGGSNLQQLGLRETTSGKAGFITGLYVVAVPVMLSIVYLIPQRWWKRESKSISWAVWLASILAAAGLYLLSAAEDLSLGRGDGIVLMGTFFWALHIFAVGYFARRVNTLHLALAQYLTCGVLNMIAGLIFEWNTLPGFMDAWGSILYVGVFSVGIAYTLQVTAQKTAPETDASIIMSLEAVFAAFFGWVILGELLSLRQILGCALMLGGMLLAQVPAFQKKRQVLDDSNALEFEP